MPKVWFPPTDGLRRYLGEHPPKALQDPQGSQTTSTVAATPSETSAEIEPANSDLDEILSSLSASLGILTGASSSTGQGLPNAVVDLTFVSHVRHFNNSKNWIPSAPSLELLQREGRLELHVNCEVERRTETGSWQRGTTVNEVYKSNRLTNEALSHFARRLSDAFEDFLEHLTELNITLDFSTTEHQTTMINKLSSVVNAFYSDSNPDDEELPIVEYERPESVFVQFLLLTKASSVFLDVWMEA